MSYTFLTGATGGLGKGFAVECARRGQNLFLTSTKEDKLGILADAIMRAYPVVVKYKKCNMASDSERAELFEYLKTENITFDRLINTAGLDYEGEFTSLGSDKIKNLIRVNVESVIDTTYSILKLRTFNEKFTIITVSSMAGAFAMPLKALYSSSKRMLTNFFLALKKELENDNVSVTILCPAGIPTNPEWTRSVESQGFISLISTKNVGIVVYNTLNKAEKGKTMYIPGFFNFMGTYLGRLLPVSIMNNIIYNRWQKTRLKAAKMQMKDI